MSKVSTTLAALGVVAGLGVAALPLSTYAIDPVAKDSTINAEVKETLTMTMSSTDDATAGSTIDLGVLEADGAIESADLTVKVKTSNKGGYNITLADKDGDNALTSGSDTIEAGTPAVGKSAWGFKMGAITTADGATQSAAAVSDYIAVPVNTAPVTIVNSDKPTKVDATTPANNGDTAVITFGASASSAQAAGKYSDVITVTAAANAA